MEQGRRAELNTVAVRDGRGQITGYLGIHRDVTGRKEADEKLRAEQRRNETILESITDAVVAVDHEWRYTYVNDRALARMHERAGEALLREHVLGKSMWEMFPDVVGTEIYDRYQEAMREQRVVEFETYFEPSGEWIEAHAYPSEDGLSIYYRDIAERKGSDEERERWARQQGLVAELGLRALASDDLQQVMDEAVELVARTLEVELAGIAEILPGRAQLLWRAGVGWREGVVGVETGNAGRDSLVGYTAKAGGPVVSENVDDDERFGRSALLASHEAVSAATVLIAGREEAFGALGVFARHARSFSDRDVSFLQVVANLLAAAVQRVESESRVIGVREAERRRIARDLHDEALQALTDGLAQATRAQSAPAGTTADGHAADLVPMLERVAQQLRAAIYDLRLAAEEDRPFPDLLEDLVGLNRELADGCDVQLEVRDDVPSGPLGQRGTEVLRVVGEALVNARRHSQARKIDVRARGSGDRLCVEVSDEGQGFDAAAVGGTGIRSMHERADLLDGTLDIRSAPGSGTTVRLELSLRNGRQVRVLLVEDHATVREAIAAMFERERDFAVVGQAASVDEARGMLGGVDVAVVDLGLPDGYGGDLIRELRDVSPLAQALVLSANVDRAETARAVESGADAVLDKAVHLDEVVDAVRRLRAGEALVPIEEVVELLRFAAGHRDQELKDRQAAERLTPREREVLQALADGLDSHAIAGRLYISLRTERNHIANILSKLDVHSQLQALVFAVRSGVVEIRRP